MAKASTPGEAKKERATPSKGNKSPEGKKKAVAAEEAPAAAAVVTKRKPAAAGAAAPKAADAAVDVKASAPARTFMDAHGPEVVFIVAAALTAAGAWGKLATVAAALAATDAVKHAVVVTEWLEGAAFPLATVPVSVLDLCGSILVCYGYRQWLQTAANVTPPRKSWFESLVACTLMQFGGTTLTGLVLGQTPSWIVSHSAFPALLLAWWLTFFCPWDLYYTFVASWEGEGARFVAGLLGAVSAGHAVTSWGLDKAAFNTFHVNHVRISQSALTCVLCGTLSGCGGGLLNNWLRMSETDAAFTVTRTPAMFDPLNYRTTAALTRSFVCAVLYYCMLNQHGYLPWPAGAVSKEHGHLVVVTLQVAHFLLAHLGVSDPFYWLATFVREKLLLVAPVVSGAGGGPLEPQKTA